MHPRGQDGRTAPEEGRGEGPTEACAAAAFAFAGIRAALHARRHAGPHGPRADGRAGQRDRAERLEWRRT